MGFETMNARNDDRLPLPVNYRYPDSAVLMKGNGMRIGKIEKENFGLVPLHTSSANFLHIVVLFISR